MRAISHIIRVLVGLVLLTLPVAGISQQRSEADVLEDLRREWQDLAQGRTEFEVAVPELVPSFLRRAADQAGCQYKDGMKLAPVRFLRVASGQRRLAFVVCYGTLKSTQRVFDLSNLRRPKGVKFPILAYPDGIGTSEEAPGFMTWDKQTGLFSAETTSDVSNATRERYTYRFGTYDFELLRVETQRDGVGEWVPLWNAQRLHDLLAKPN